MKKLLLILLVGLGLSVQAQEVQKNIAIEHFTNTLCGICASKNPAFFSTLSNYNNIVHIAYHPSSPYPSCVFNQHDVSGNNSRTDYYGLLGSTPRVVVNGIPVNISTPLLNDSRIQTEVSLTSPIRIDVDQQLISNDSLEITITINTVAPTSLTTANMYVVVSEQRINYQAPNGENTHFDVFRRAPAGNGGMTINIPANGSSESFTFKTIIDQEWNIPEITSSVILNDGPTKEVIQSEQSAKFGGSVSISELEGLDNLYYPNPAKEFVTIVNPEKQFSSLDIYNIIGSQIGSYNLENTDKRTISISDFPEGNYILRFSTNLSETITRKLVVNK